MWHWLVGRIEWHFKIQLQMLESFHFKTLFKPSLKKWSAETSSRLRGSVCARINMNLNSNKINYQSNQRWSGKGTFPLLIFQLKLSRWLTSSNLIIELSGFCFLCFSPMVSVPYLPFFALLCTAGAGWLQTTFPRIPCYMASLQVLPMGGTGGRSEGSKRETSASDTNLMAGTGSCW